MSQFEMEYSADSRSLRYPLENLVPGSMQLIFSEQIGPWLPPHAHEPIDSAEQKRIATRIVQIMHFLGDHKFEVA